MWLKVLFLGWYLVDVSNTLPLKTLIENPPTRGLGSNQTTQGPLNVTNSKPVNIHALPKTTKIIVGLTITIIFLLPCLCICYVEHKRRSSTRYVSIDPMKNEFLKFLLQHASRRLERQEVNRVQELPDLKSDSGSNTSDERNSKTEKALQKDIRTYLQLVYPEEESGKEDISSTDPKSRILKDISSTDERNSKTGKALQKDIKTYLQLVYPEKESGKEDISSTDPKSLE